VLQKTVPRPTGSEHTFAQAVVSSSGPIALVLLLPLMIIAVGVPVALAVRGVLELVQWLITAMR
jgi:hypothetical protein